MTAALCGAIGDSLALLAERDALTAAQRNYRSAMLADLLACQLRDLASVSATAAVDAYDSGQDVMAHDIGELLLDMRRDGADDGQALGGVLQLVQLRMGLGLPVADMFGGDAGA